MTTNSLETRPFDSSFHHESHWHLLADVPVAYAPQARVDALIVPTARPVGWLREAMRLACDLNCGLVAMCSRGVKATEVADLGDQLGVSVIAVDVTDHSYGLPKFSTVELLDRTVFTRSSDTAKKRNLALLLSRMAGWERIFFLDDDIYAIDPAEVRSAVALLDKFDAIGMHNIGYPDNSVVCHVHRELGAEQAQFIGAGALAISPLTSRSFFPNTYNQDWFLILGYGEPTTVAITGQMRQKEYDPFADPNRARREELGDCLAEGLYWLLDHRLPIQSADVVHWRDFLSRRAYFVDYLITNVHNSDLTEDWKERVLASLRVARSTGAHITPGLCTSYMRRWQADLECWQRFIDEQPVCLGLDKALEQLRWPGVAKSSLPWPSQDSDSVVDEDRLLC